MIYEFINFLKKIPEKRVLGDEILKKREES